MMHVLASFRHCPRCGSAAFDVHDARSKRCAACGFTYYHNASAATAAFVVNAAGELLVLRRAFDPARGTLDLPGGFAEPDETLEESCLREVREETGCPAVIERYLFSLPNTYRYSDFDVHTADAFFRVRLTDLTNLQAHDDAAALFWVPLTAVRPEKFGLASVSKGVALFLQSLQTKRPDIDGGD